MTNPEPKRRGRPTTGKAKSATARAKAHDAALLAAGGRILNKVRLSREAADALSQLSHEYGSDREAIEQALTQQAAQLKRLNVARNDK